MLKSKNYWKIKKVDEEKMQRLSESLHISVLTARLLVARGFDDAEQAKHFLHCESMKFYESMKMKGMDKAVVRVSKAVTNGEQIRVFGDYDADGVTSTAILIRALTSIGAHVSYYIPNRFKDGYGPNVGAVEQAKKDGVTLIITVDSGIAASDPAECAKRMGIDYVITDHHEPPDQLPEAFAILNPKQKDCPYPFKGLSGAGIALKLAQAICPSDTFDEKLVALAAIGTIADLVPLVDENRLIAYLGLKTMNAGSLPGIDALKIKASGAGMVDSDVIGFQMAPRLNAAGRMNDARAALELLLTEDVSEAAALAEQLDSLNQDRRAIVDRIAREADAQAAGYISRGDKALVLAGTDWHQGVIGIAASKIVGKYYRPVIILSIDEETGIAKGSGRSIEGFNLYQGLKDASNYLIQFGGHQMAAGMTVAKNEIDAFRKAFADAAARVLQPEDLVPQLTIDGVSSVDDLSVDLIEELAQLAPFGTDNPRPLFQIEQAPLAKLGAVGRNNNHLKVTLKGGEKELEAIGFGFGSWMSRISPNDHLVAVGELGINEWNGFRKVQLLIRDLCVEGIQVYDWRSVRDIHEKTAQLVEDSVTLLAFQPETAAHFQLEGIVQVYESGMSVPSDAVAFLDLPDDEAQLADMIGSNPQLNRFYCIFYHPEDHYFTVFPERDHFVWYYALIRKRHSFDVQEMIRQIAGYKGWSEQSISLMTQVFFELGFVKIEKGFLTENPSPVKAPLTSSDTYRKEKMQRRLEARFCYSPIGELKQWIMAQFMHERVLK
ncbi:single-stranded-DNA-specific exonuclease RecJ [Sporolactobacillus shoreicorticis]|uniref:Single-stranded-DNA-specific exonuclease RecJ n=1 Tax=Sporolactobacillus shoreicorticis TaxID=1923877 RepID=A0ABW5S410_9BACL|nr:single-stranded-DNA-specific exonuclease RecJ [Sporolactobacillus shoreicorticis]MCO7126403.1 single-stranded-DNA-specific exonuclease RecJ [Sporolactobacillus shoreicorticis]